MNPEEEQEAFRDMSIAMTSLRKSYIIAFVATLEIRDDLIYRTRGRTAITPAQWAEVFEQGQSTAYGSMMADPVQPIYGGIEGDTHDRARTACKEAMQKFLKTQFGDDGDDQA